MLAAARSATSRVLSTSSISLLSSQCRIRAANRLLNPLQTPLEAAAACRLKSGGPGGAVVGIDLGTTNSCVAVMEGKVRFAITLRLLTALVQS